MNDFSANPPAAAERLSFFQVMLRAYTGPSLTNYRYLARNTEASLGKAFLWVAITALVSSLISALLGSKFLANPSLIYRYAVGDGLERILGSALRTTGFGSTTTALLLGVLQVIIISVISFAIDSGLLHLVARLLGGKGDYEEQAFLLAAISAPFTIYSSLASATPFPSCIGVLVELYGVVLTVLAVYGVYQFSLGKAVGTLLIWSIAMILLASFLRAGLEAL